MQLNKQKPYATVAGYDPSIKHQHEQDGRYFDGAGVEVDPKTGKRVDAHHVPDRPTPEKNLGEKIPPKEFTGLSWSQGEDQPETIARLVTIDYEGELIPVDLDEASYDTPKDIKEVLDKLGASYHPNHQRKVLWRKLMARVEELK
jgi:hypothetical protein